MEEKNLVEVDDMSFDIESLVDDTQLSAEAVCACGTSACMCSCSTCVDEN